MQRNMRTSDSTRNRAAINWPNLETSGNSDVTIKKSPSRAHEPLTTSPKRVKSPQAAKSDRTRRKQQRGRERKFAIQEAAYVLNFTSPREW
jgi:hypothetical protein